MKVVRKSKGNMDVLISSLSQMDHKTAKVGWFKSAVYPSGASVAMVARVHEYGYEEKNIPPRPFFRSTVHKKSSEWKKKISEIAKAILSGKINTQQGFEAIGLMAAGDVRETITRITSPTLKKRTIKARLSKMKNKKTVGNLDKPLVETAHMLNTLTHLVENK